MEACMGISVYVLEWIFRHMYVMGVVATVEGFSLKSTN